MNEKGIRGITVGGKDLAEYIIEQENDEKKKQADEAFHQGSSKTTHYHAPTRVKVKGKQGRSGMTTLLTRRQINCEYWRDNMESSITFMEQIIVALLRGKLMDTKELTELLQQFHHGKKINVPSALSKLWKTPLKPLLKKVDISATGKPKYKWGLVEEALDMTSKELHGLYNTRNTAITYDSLMEKYPWLEKYKPEETEFIKTIKKTRDDKEKDLPRKPAPTADLQEQAFDIVKESLEKALGLNVTIEGSIKILFGFAK